MSVKKINFPRFFLLDLNLSLFRRKMFVIWEKVIIPISFFEKRHFFYRNYLFLWRFSKCKLCIITRKFYFYIDSIDSIYINYLPFRLFSLLFRVSENLAFFIISFLNALFSIKLFTSNEIYFIFQNKSLFLVIFKYILNVFSVFNKMKVENSCLNK